MAYIAAEGTLSAQGLRAMLKGLLDGREQLLRVRDAMIQARDTTPDPDDYSQVEAQFGMPEGTGALAFAEVDALNGHMQNATAALRQTAAIFGVVGG